MTGRGTQRQPPSDDERLAVTLTVAELRQLVSQAVKAALEGGVRAPQLVVDKQTLARQLRCSAGHIDALRKRGLPTIMLGQAPRFDSLAVLEWLRQRQLAEPPPADVD